MVLFICYIIDINPIQDGGEGMEAGAAKRSPISFSTTSTSVGISP